MQVGVQPHAAGEQVCLQGRPSRKGGKSKMGGRSEMTARPSPRRQACCPVLPAYLAAGTMNAGEDCCCGAAATLLRRRALRPAC